VKPHPHLMVHLQRAEESVQSAQRSWNATDISRCAECVEHLRQAAEEIQAAQQFTAEAALPAAELAAKANDRLHRLHGSVNRLGRLVDAAIAFHRGLALQSGMEEAMSSEVNG
jgi:hypothetical protein